MRWAPHPLHIKPSIPMSKVRQGCAVLGETINPLNLLLNPVVNQLLMIVIPLRALPLDKHSHEDLAVSGDNQCGSNLMLNMVVLLSSTT